jgi:hypothetical protein
MEGDKVKPRFEFASAKEATDNLDAGFNILSYMKPLFSYPGVSEERIPDEIRPLFERWIKSIYSSYIHLVKNDPIFCSKYFKLLNEYELSKWNDVLKKSKTKSEDDIKNHIDLSSLPRYEKEDESESEKEDESESEKEDESESEKEDSQTIYVVAHYCDYEDGCYSDIRCQIDKCFLTRDKAISHVDTEYPKYTFSQPDLKNSIYRKKIDYGYNGNAVEVVRMILE